MMYILPWAGADGELKDVPPAEFLLDSQHSWSEEAIKSLIDTAEVRRVDEGEGFLFWFFFFGGGG